VPRIRASVNAEGGFYGTALLAALRGFNFRVAKLLIAKRCRCQCKIQRRPSPPDQSLPEPRRQHQYTRQGDYYITSNIPRASSTPSSKPTYSYASYSSPKQAYGSHGLLKGHGIFKEVDVWVTNHFGIAIGIKVR
jgi:hypothetical protein